MNFYNIADKKMLLEFIEETKLGCTHLQLKTKLMNEQNKQQAVAKQRWHDMQDK